jgi:hypothetical protein
VDGVAELFNAGCEHLSQGTAGPAMRNRPQGVASWRAPPVGLTTV